MLSKTDLEIKELLRKIHISHIYLLHMFLSKLVS